MSAPLPRTPTSMWALMVWAYSRQLVVRAVSPARPGGGGDWLELGTRVDVSHGWSGFAGPVVHDDAVVVHDAVMKATGGGGDRYQMLVRCAQTGMVPDFRPVLPDCRFGPRRDELNQIVVVRYRCPVKHRNIALYCPLHKTGYSQGEKRIILERNCQIYSDWVDDLTAVWRELLSVNPKLRRWKIESLGVVRASPDAAAEAEA